MHRSFMRPVQAVLFAVAAVCSSPASAAKVTLSGTSFDLSYDSALQGLLGIPLLQGNTISFAPASFRAESLSGAGKVTVAPIVDMQLSLHPGQRITGIVFSEQGSFRLSGAQSYVDVRGDLAVTFAAAGAAALTQPIAPFGFLDTSDGVVRAWQASGALDLGGVALSVQAQGISLGLRPVLEARTLATDVGLRVATVATGGDLVLTVSTVPEPESYALLTAGLALVGLVAARRRPRG